MFNESARCMACGKIIEIEKIKTSKIEHLSEKLNFLGYKRWCCRSYILASINTSKFRKQYYMANVKKCMNK